MPRKPKKQKGVHEYKLSTGKPRYKCVIYHKRAGKSRPFWFHGFSTATAASKQRNAVLQKKEDQGLEFVPEDYQTRQNPRKYQSSKKKLFETIATEWLKRKKQQLKVKKLSKSRVDACEGALDNFLLPLYSGIPISEVTRASWVEKLYQMEADGDTWHVRHQATACLHDLFTYATNLAYVSGNPLTDMSSVLGEKPKSNRAPLTEEERVKFLAAARIYRKGEYYALLHGMLEGPRPGEQLALEIDGFYPQRKMIHVKWNYTQEGLKELPKDKEERYLPLTTETTRLYIIQAEKATREQIDAGLPPRWLFPNLRAEGPDKLFSHGKLREIFSAVCRLAEIRRAVPYEGRTTAACTMIHKGASLAEVSEHLGHSNLASTRIYTEKSVLLGPPAAPQGPRPVDRLDLPSQPDEPTNGTVGSC